MFKIIDLYENLSEILYVFYGTNGNKIVLYLRINTPINSFVDKELFLNIFN